LIVCEGTKTEPLDFKQFRVNAVVELVVLGLGDDPLNLVRFARDKRREGDFSQAWCVFDRDPFTADRFNAALTSARRAGIRVAYSNEAFELWYLLRFDYLDTATSRADYLGKLTDRLGFPYVKNSRGMYASLLLLQPDAIRNARRLLGFWGSDHRPERDNPCATVHVLVEELNRPLK
jgi:hypothetical protein